MASDPLGGIQRGVDALRSAWGVSSSCGPLAGVDELGASELVAVHEGLAGLQRQVEAVQARVVARIAQASRPELGADGLAKQQGYRNPVALVAAVTGTTGGDAARLIRVGEATAPRMTLTGEAMPAKHPHVAAALESGVLATRAAAAIVTMLDRVALRCRPGALDDAERILCAQAPGLALDQLAKAIARAEAHLDPGGIEAREQERRAHRALRIFERDGMIHVDGRFDAESGAPIKTAVEALVTAMFRARAEGDDQDADGDTRTVVQRQADALTQLCAHFLGCDHNDIPTGGATVVVRVALEDLEAGTGHATIDGITEPVSISAARRIAAGGGVIPCVLGSDSEILDWGRIKRLFTRAQKLALTERDGGCALCGLPPGMTKVHHLRWWARDAGPTNLSNGILLCESCHHRIHDNGWDIRIQGTGIRAKVWFIPPPHVDPTQTPRLGGRARFDYAA